MTLLFTDGFEGGNGNPKADWINQATVTATGRTGTYALTTTSGVGSKLRVAASSKITTGFAANIPGTTNCLLATFFGDTGATQHLSLTLNLTTFLWELRRGSSAGTIIATGTHPMDLNIWRNMQISATISDTVGTCVLKIDGVTDINFTGDTKNAGTNSTIDAIGYIGNGSGSAQRIDDLWVCDGVDATATQDRPNNDFLGDLKVVALNPTGAGDLTQWVPSTGANWTDVDEVPANTTDFVSSNVAGNKDLYVMSDLPSGVTTVYGLQVMGFAQKTDTGARGFKTAIKENSVVTVEASSHALSTSWLQYNGPLIAVKPSNGAVFSVADVNALQAGVECESA